MCVLVSSFLLIESKLINIQLKIYVNFHFLDLNRSYFDACAITRGEHK